MTTFNNIVNISVQNELVKLDYELFLSKSSDYQVISKRVRILIIDGVFVKIQRRYYLNKKDNTYHFLLDEFLGINYTWKSIVDTLL